MIVLILLAGGMSFFDSLCNSFGTTATSGFSPNTLLLIVGISSVIMSAIGLDGQSALGSVLATLSGLVLGLVVLARQIILPIYQILEKSIFLL